MEEIEGDGSLQAGRVVDRLEWRRIIFETISMGTSDRLA